MAQPRGERPARKGAIILRILTPPTFDNSYARLPAKFYAPAQPGSCSAPKLLRLNKPLAEKLGLDPSWLASEAGLAMLSGGQLPAGAEPIAMAYAGHQFGGWSPQLGDGRAILLGEIIAKDGVRHDIQLKGSGRTRWSRSGDGKAGLGPVLREYIVSEAMAALGVPTTRALAAVTTGERILRRPPEPGAIVARVARSHVRIGTFQYFYARQDGDAVKRLADYVIARHYPEVDGAEVDGAEVDGAEVDGAEADGAEVDNVATGRRYRMLFQYIVKTQAQLVAQWMALGFIHGVMNTDNVQIAGETLDYGPCAFIDNYHPNKVFSSIDRNGRYAWGNQPTMAQWNLTRLAETLLPLLNPDKDEAVAWVKEALAGFQNTFVKRLGGRFRAKLGLLDDASEHGDMVNTTLATLATHAVDFTLFFRHLTRVADGAPADDLRALFDAPSACDVWLTQWRQQLKHDPDPAAQRLARMRRSNPILIPRNHRIEEAIQAAYREDYAPFHRLVEALANPFEEQPEHAELELAPQPDEVVEHTFCGT